MSQNKTPQANTSLNSAKSSSSAKQKAAAAAASVLPFADVSSISLSESMTATPKSAGPSTKPKPSTSSGVSTRNRPEVVLPQTKVKLIMKTSPAVENIGHDALYMITKSTELFVDHMASEAFTNAKSKSLEYKHLADLVQSTDNMAFLKEIIPKKVSARVALLEVARQKEQMQRELLQ